MLAFFLGGIGKWLLGGVFAAAVVAGAIAWHSMNFVSKAEVKQCKAYVSELIAASKEKERIGIQAEKEREVDEKKIDEMEKENERLNAEDRKGDDPVFLDSDDLKRLRR